MMALEIACNRSSNVENILEYLQHVVIIHERTVSLRFMTFRKHLRLCTPLPSVPIYFTQKNEANGLYGQARDLRYLVQKLYLSCFCIFNFE